jgi:hypothetical protein
MTHFKGTLARHAAYLDLKDILAESENFTSDFGVVPGQALEESLKLYCNGHR